jgi:hypothetical protein
VVPIASETAAIEAQYSQPWPGLNTKKPFFRWATQMATTISATIAPAASEVSRPTASSTPAPISVAAASRACHNGHLNPIDPNQLAVPARRPPPTTLFTPWAAMNRPNTTRRNSTAIWG